MKKNAFLLSITLLTSGLTALAADWIPSYFPSNQAVLKLGLGVQTCGRYPVSNCWISGGQDNTVLELRPVPAPYGYEIYAGTWADTRFENGHTFSARIEISRSRAQIETEATYTIRAFVNGDGGSASQLVLTLKNLADLQTTSLIGAELSDGYQTYSPVLMLGAAVAAQPSWQPSPYPSSEPSPYPSWDPNPYPSALPSWAP